jgi:hypothetical protein
VGRQVSSFCSGGPSLQVQAESQESFVGELKGVVTCRPSKTSLAKDFSKSCGLLTSIKMTTMAEWLSEWCSGKIDVRN